MLHDPRRLGDSAVRRLGERASQLSIIDNRRWRSATGGCAFVLALSLLAVVWRGCDREPSTIGVAVHAYDSASHTTEGRITRERAVVAAAARAESAASARARAMRSAVARSPITSTTDSRFTMKPEVQTDQVDARIDAILATQDTALAWAHVQTAALDTALGLSDVRAARADSLLHIAVQEGDRPCRLARIVPCPSRRVSALIGAAAALGAVVLSR